MAADQHIDSLIATLTQTVESGLAYFQGPGGAARVKIGRCGPREILCQLVWWHQVTTEGIESVASGGAPYRIYAAVDEMNARAVGRLSGKTIEQMAAMVRQWQARLVRAVAALPDANATVLVMGDGSERSIQQRLEAMVHEWDENVKALQTLSAA